MSQTVRHALSICFFVSILGIAAARVSRVDGSKFVGKIAKNEDGDIYDCIDFYKQPAFDHPLLKNHSYHHEMRPTFHPETIKTNNLSSKMNTTENETENEIVPLKNGGCPRGTVPIRRINKNRTVVHPPRYPKVNISNTATNGEISGVVYALGQTKGNDWKIYNGVSAIITAYNPRALSSQYTSGEIILKGGADTLIAGWTVNPQKYSDYKSRFFAYAVAGGMHCFNAECGFVSVSPFHPLDFEMKPVSKRDGDIYANKFYIFKDRVNGMWWLVYGMKDETVLGFWPREIFKGMHDGATYAACGGEVYTPASLPPPEMGTGYLPQIGFDDYAYCREFNVVDDKNYVVTAQDTEPYVTNEAYGVFDQYYRPSHYVQFGGPTGGVM